MVGAASSHVLGSLGHLLPLKRESSVVPETGGKYSLFIPSSAASLTSCYIVSPFKCFRNVGFVRSD